MVARPFTRIAIKYDLTAAGLDRLSKKIIMGGKGVWSELPMVPHPELSQADAKTMVKYILLLKK